MKLALTAAGFGITGFVLWMVWHMQPEPEWKQRLLAKLTDPTSAQIRNVEIGDITGWVCGEVNSKNRMGGYVGFKDFMIMQPNPPTRTDWNIYIEGEYAAVTGGC